MTALISAFSRAYHSLNNEVKIFDDNVARNLLTEEEYSQISKSMSNGISFFNPTFVGNPQEALRWVVDNQLSPSPLGRADFTEISWQKSLLNYKAFDSNRISFCTILGLAYYLSKQTFETLISVISGILPKGSSIIFDYPDENSYTEKVGERAKTQSMLAGAANEKMLASYSYAEMAKLLSAHDFLIYEHLTPQEMTEQYFEDYNKVNQSHRMTAFDNVNYCLAVKK